MVGGSTARTPDYLGFLVAASVWALLSAGFCTGRSVLLLEVAVKSEISIYPGPHRPHCER
jgi:hypothetical protein